jgi:hypothetical protein
VPTIDLLECEMVGTLRFAHPTKPSLRAKRSNPSRHSKEEWIASSLRSLQ